VSQPSLCLFPLQSAHPDTHVPLHTLLPHAALMLFAEQATPQPPQLFTSELVLASHPSLCLLLLQSDHPASQAPLHAPSLQVGVPMLLPEQTRPHTPQLEVLPATLISHPSSWRLLLQSAHPALQVPVQTPPVQVGVTLFVEQ